MEPFYKGSWGMSPAEIKSLYAETDFQEREVAEKGLIDTYIMQTVDGRTFATSYFFADDGGREPVLYSVWAAFNIDSITLAESEKLAADLMAVIEAGLSGDPKEYQRFIGQPATNIIEENDENETYAEVEVVTQQQRACWLGAENCINLIYSWTKFSDINAGLVIDIDFWNVKHPAYQEYYNQVVVNYNFSETK